jgi:hypothetical protein
MEYEGEILWHLKPKLVYVVDAPGNDGNASIPEQVKRSIPWRKMMLIIMMIIIITMTCAGSIKG